MMIPDLISLDNPDKYTAGATHWFEGDFVFAELVTQLQKEGKIGTSPYTLPLPYLSVSAVEQYLRCPKQFEFRYVYGIRKPPGIALVQGSAIHRTVELSYVHLVKNATPPPLEMCLDTYSTDLEKRLQEEVIWDAAEEDELPQDAGKVKDQGIGLVKVWHKNKLPKVRPHKVEASFVTSFGSVPVVGRVDFVDRVGELLDPTSARDFDDRVDVIVDNKVLGKAPTKASVDNKLQLSTYAAVTGVPRQRLDVFTKTKVPKVMEMITSRDEKQVRWAIRTFVDVARAIHAGVFPPCNSDSWACTPRFCGYWDSCRGAE